MGTEKDKILRELESSILLHIEDFIQPIPSYEYRLRFIPFPTPMRKHIYGDFHRDEEKNFTVITEQNGAFEEEIEEEELLDRDALSRARKLRSEVRDVVQRNTCMMNSQFKRLVDLTVKVNSMRNSLQKLKNSLSDVDNNMSDKVDLLRETLLTIEQSMNKTYGYQYTNNETVPFDTVSNGCDDKKNDVFSKTELAIISKFNEGGNKRNISEILDEESNCRKEKRKLTNPEKMFSRFISST